MFRRATILALIDVFFFICPYILYYFIGLGTEEITLKTNRSSSYDLFHGISWFL